MPDKNNYLFVYKGKHYAKPYHSKSHKVIAFDLDETLGSFADLNILWSGINSVRKNTILNEQADFNELLDLYPEFLRHGIVNILEYLSAKKKQGICHKIYIYTNNNCNPPWVSLISNYFTHKLKLESDLFDKTISAFKINNKVIELARTTKDKTHNDFITCTVLPKCTEICFVDNTYYHEMIHERVYYIQPRSYYHYLSVKQILDRFLNSNYCANFIHIFDNKPLFHDYLYDWFEYQQNGIRPIAPSVDFNVFVAQKMMYHIKEFFYLTNRKSNTRKTNVRIGKKTRKKRTIS